MKRVERVGAASSRSETGPNPPLTYSTSPHFRLFTLFTLFLAFLITPTDRKSVYLALFFSRLPEATLLLASWSFWDLASGGYAHS